MRDEDDILMDIKSFEAMFKITSDKIKGFQMKMADEISALEFIQKRQKELNHELTEYRFRHCEKAYEPKHIEE